VPCLLLVHALHPRLTVAPENGAIMAGKKGPAM
jgi:hypothetical protein